MNTLKLLKKDYAAVIDKIRRGESLTAHDRRILKIGGSLYGGKSGNAGKRKGSGNIQKVR